MCVKCGKHKATVNITPNGGLLDFIHDEYERWCECCATRFALDHAKASAARIPELERKLANLVCN